MTQRGTWGRLGAQRLSRRRALVAGGGGLAALLLAACGGGDGDSGSSSTSNSSGGTQTAGVQQGRVTTAQAEQIRRGGALKVGVTTQPTSLDPHLGRLGSEHKFVYPLFDSLITYDAKGLLNPEQSLAEKWEVASPTRVVLNLRSGVKMHDGSEVNAELVKWNLERNLDPAQAATARPDIGAIDKVEAVNASTVALTLKQPSAGLLTNFGDRAGFIVSRAAVEKQGKEDFALRPVGSGPFIFKEWRDQSFLVYEKNPTYWRKAADGGAFPYVDSIRFDIMPEDTVLVAALESGQQHVIAAPASQLDVLDANKNLQSSEFVGSSIGVIYINHALAPWDNADFRRAMAWGTDKSAFINAFFGNRQPAAQSYFPVSSWASHPVADVPKFDLNRAREFMTKSGIPESARNVNLYQLNAGGTTQAELFQEQWNKLGVKTRIYTRDEVTGKGPKRTPGNDGTVAYVSGLSLRVDPDAFISQLLTDEGTYNWGLAPCPGCQERIEKARTIYDTEERKKLYFEADEIAAREVFSAMLLQVGVNRANGVKQLRGLDTYWGGEGKERYANLWLAS